MATVNNIKVYRHRRLDTNEVFYVGIGKGNRPYEKKHRNSIWKNITNKTDYIVEILYDNLFWNDACELEYLLIQEYGKIKTKTGSLANITDGGEGAKGLIHTKETKKKLSKAGKGRKAWNKDLKGFRKGYKQTKDWKEKRINSISNKVINIETKEIFNSQKEAADSLSISTAWFSICINNKKDFKFKYYGR